MTSDEIREGLSAFFADTSLDEFKPELDVPTETTTVRQLDASDFIIDSIDVEVGTTVEAEVPEVVVSEVVELAVEASSEDPSEELIENEPALDELQLVEPITDESDVSDVIEAEYASSLDDVVETDMESELAAFSDDGETEQPEVKPDFVSHTGDLASGDTSGHSAVLMNEVDIDLFGESVEAQDSSSDEMSTHKPVSEERVSEELHIQEPPFEESSSEQPSFEESSADEELLDYTSEDMGFDESQADYVGTIETDLDHSVQVTAGELQPIVSSALVVNQKSTEIAEYYPVIDPLDSTQSDLDLDMPHPPVPGGFIRRWYIRGASFLKRMWRRIRRTSS